MNNIDILEIIKDSFDLLEVEIEHDYYGTDYAVLYKGGAIRYIEEKIEEERKKLGIENLKDECEKDLDDEDTLML